MQWKRVNHVRAYQRPVNNFPSISLSNFICIILFCNEFFLFGTLFPTSFKCYLLIFSTCLCLRIHCRLFAFMHCLPKQTRPNFSVSMSFNTCCKGLSQIAIRNKLIHVQLFSHIPAIFRKTRKPSWNKGKRATAVHVWIPLAKMLQKINAKNNVEKYIQWATTLFCAWQYGYIFIRLAVVASQICEITRNSEKIRYST